MKTIIYYFTGTGNSLAAAKKIAEGRGDCELVPIALLRNTTGDQLKQERISDRTNKLSAIKGLEHVHPVTLGVE